MNKSIVRVALSLVLTLCCGVVLAQSYPGIVSLESLTDKQAVFTSMGVADKKSDVELNAAQSLFNTLFYMGVDGINNGNPLVTSDNPDYIQSFLAVKATLFGGSRTATAEPVKNSQKKFEATYRITVPIQNLYKELTVNGVCKGALTSSGLADVDAMQSVTLPSIMVVPYKKDGESYDKILQNNFDIRTAVAKVQDGFEGRGITTVDFAAKLAAVNRRMQYEASTASSNDKYLLASSGADVYVTVDVQKDENASGTRATLIMKAYETSTGSILASKSGFSNRFRVSSQSSDLLYAHIVKENIPSFLNDITKNLNKQVVSSSRVVLQIAIGGGSMMSMNDKVGPSNLQLSDVIRQWVRKNADNGKYNLQGVVAESMVFDYVMIPPKDSDGLKMDAAQFAFLLHSYLSGSQGVKCSSKVDGSTVYITIE